MAALITNMLLFKKNSFILINIAFPKPIDNPIYYSHYFGSGGPRQTLAYQSVQAYFLFRRFDC
jgi:hypothetical protein